MLFSRLINQGPAPMLEQWLQFTDQRHRLLAEDIANANTPGYVQKDLSLAKFQSLLRQRVQERDAAPLGTSDFADVMPEVENGVHGVMFQDGNNRSMEQLMTDEAKNALMHTLAVELLRQQYSMLDMALKEKVS